MSDQFKKVLDAIKKVIEDLKKKDSVKKVIEELRKKDSVKSLEKISKNLKDVTDKTGVELKKIADKSGVDVNKITKQAGEFIERTGKPIQKAAGPPGRPMKYPYTISAKIAQFPFKFYIENNWMFKYYLIAVVVCIPVFKYFENMAKSPANVKAWREQKKAERAGHH